MGSWGLHMYLTFDLLTLWSHTDCMGIQLTFDLKTFVIERTGYVLDLRPIDFWNSVDWLCTWPLTYWPCGIPRPWYVLDALSLAEHMFYPRLLCLEIYKDIDCHIHTITSSLYNVTGPNQTCEIGRLSMITRRYVGNQQEKNHYRIWKTAEFNMFR